MTAPALQPTERAADAHPGEADVHRFRYEELHRRHVGLNRGAHRMELVLIVVVLGIVAVLALTAVARDLSRANRERSARARAHGAGAAKRQ